MGEDRDFKFGRYVDPNKSCPMDDKPPLKGVWSGNITHINF